VRRNSLIRPCSSVATSEGIMFLVALIFHHRGHREEEETSNVGAKK